MTLNQVRYFHTIAQTGSMGQAAKQLYISQPSLSVAVDRLEEELGLSLFDRIGHRLVLTPEGEIFLSHAEKILAAAEDALRHMEDLRHSQDALLRLGCIDPTLTKLVPDLMRRFLDQPAEKATQFELFTDTTPQLIKRLEAGEIDLALCSASDAKGICQQPLDTLPLTLIRPAEQESFPAADTQPAGSAPSDGSAPSAEFKPPASWAEIATLPLIGYIPDSAMDHLLQQIAASEHVSFSFRYRAPTEEAIAGLVSNGFGYGIVPVTEPLKGNPHVARCPLPGSPHRQTIFLTSLERHTYRGAAARFMAFLKTGSGK